VCIAETAWTIEQNQDPDESFKIQVPTIALLANSKFDDRAKKSYGLG